MLGCGCTNVKRLWFLCFTRQYTTCARASQRALRRGGDFAIALRAKYLCVYLGLERGNRPCDKPVQKFIDRAKTWSSICVGMHITARSYNVYMASVLSFIGQVEMLLDSWEEYEARACRILFKGPTGWMQPGCRQALKHVGFPTELPDMPCHTISAKCT